MPPFARHSSAFSSISSSLCHSILSLDPEGDQLPQPLTKTKRVPADLLSFHPRKRKPYLDFARLAQHLRLDPAGGMFSPSWSDVKCEL
jgi:hypothetical protein